MIHKCAICSKVISGNILIRNINDVIYFCSTEHLADFVAMNYKGKAPEMFGKEEKLVLSDGEIDPEDIQIKSQAISLGGKNAKTGLEYEDDA